jgi:hypothetical protein
MTAGSPNFNPAAWERSVARLHGDLQLTAEDAGTILRAVGADRPRSLGRLDRYLCRNKLSVLTPTLDCPAVMMRLALHLATAGYGGAVPLSCSRCGRQVNVNRRAGEWICERCAGHERQFICAHCNLPKTRPAMRLPEGSICLNCYAKHPMAHRPCSNCGRVRQAVRRLPDGGALCKSCAPRRQHISSRCGQTRPAQSITDEGPICNRCYRRVKLSWTCALCGAVRNRQRNTVFGPHACGSWRRTRLRNAIVASDQYSKSACAFCDKVRRVGNRWPAGPICKSCADRARRYPAQCADCQQIKVLTGLNGNRRRICGPCAGWPVDYTCRRCRRPGIKSWGLCSRRDTRQRLDAALTGPDGEVVEQLQPLVDALASARDPRSVAVWLARSAAATMLSDLASHGEPITHEMLDAVSPSPHADYVREILVRTAILEPRNEYLERLTLWLDRYLADIGDERARLLRAYAQWYLLHKARRRNGPLTRVTADNIRMQVRVAHEFLARIETKGYTLNTVCQDLVDNWLANGTTRECEIRPFLHWANQRRLTGGVVAPARIPSLPAAFLSEEEQLEQLHRCLTDDTIAVDLRAGGGLMLLYGLNLTRVLAITSNQLHQRSGDTYLMLGEHELLLPPILADLLGIDIVTATRWAGYAKRDWQTYLASKHETAQHLKVDSACR